MPDDDAQRNQQQDPAATSTEPCFCAPPHGDRSRNEAFRRALERLTPEHLRALLLMEAARRDTLPGHQCFLQSPADCPYNPYPRASASD